MNRRVAAVLALAGVAGLAAFGALAVGCNPPPKELGGATMAPAGPTPTVAVVNSRCPILDDPINPKAVPVTLTRDYKGQKVGFCCSSCPPKWDKLSDKDKDARLAKAMAPAK